MTVGKAKWSPSAWKNGGQIHRWTAPTPTSIRREQEQAEARRGRTVEEVRRLAEVAAPRPATVNLTPAETIAVAETYAAGLVRRAGDQTVRDVPAVVYARRDARPVEDVQMPAVADLPPPARPASGRKRRQGGTRHHPRRPVVPPEPEDC